MSPLYSPRALIEHVIEQLDDHASALMAVTVGSPQAQARWLRVQTENLREAIQTAEEHGW